MIDLDESARAAKAGAELLEGYVHAPHTAPDLEEALRITRQAIANTPNDHPKLAWLLHSLAVGLGYMHEITWSVDRLEEAIQAARQAVLASSGVPGRRPNALILCNLARRLDDRFSRLGTVTDLEEAIKVARDAVKFSREETDGSTLSKSLSILGSELHSRYSRLGAESDLEDAIQAAKEAIEAGDDDSRFNPWNLNTLGHGLRDKYHRTGEVAYLEEAIRVARKAAEAVDDRNHFLLLNNLGTALLDRYSRTGSSSSVEEAVQVARKALAEVPKNHPGRLGCLASLGSALHHEYSRKGAIGGLDEAISVTSEAVAGCPESHPDQAEWLNLLGSQLRDRFARTGAAKDIEAAINAARQAVALTPHDHPDRAMLLDNLGVGLGARYAKTSEPDDIREAIQLGREAISLTPRENIYQTRWLGNLVQWIALQYSRTGNMSDIEEAITLARQALAETPEDEPNRATQLNGLGVVLGTRYSRTGRIQDLEEAVLVGRQAVAATPDDLPLRVARLNNLGTWLLDMYERTGAMSDLDDAVLAWRQALASVPDGSADMPIHQGNLAVGLQERYRRTEAKADLEEAIRMTRQAIATAAEGPNLQKLINNLGGLLNDRFKLEGELADINEAIELSRRLVDGTLDDNPDLPSFMNNLAARLFRRFDETHAASDLADGLRAQTQCLVHTPEDDPNRASRLNNLGLGLYQIYLGTHVDRILGEALECFRNALHHPNSWILDRIVGGGAVLHYASDWDEAYQEASVAIGLLPMLVSRSTANSDRVHNLSQIVGISAEASVAALRANVGAGAALGLLEQGRGIVAAALEELRADLLDLHKAHPNLEARFVSLREQLEIPDTARGSLVAAGAGSRSWGPQASQQYDIDRKFEELLAEIREQPGFADFLLPPTVADMQAASIPGPIVVINATAWQCDAILVEPHRIRALALPVSMDDINERMRIGDVQSPQILEWLWDGIARPILDALGHTGPPSGSSWPRVFWIPTGPVSRFPLHAAGYHGRRGESVLDRVMSSYGSSVKTIIQSRRRRVAASSTSARAVLVAVRGGTAPLAFAGKEVEDVRALCDAMSLTPEQPAQERGDIMRHLPGCAVFHFAGHAMTDERDPVRSHLRLEDEDEPLSVADLLELNLREQPPFLAYLSACGTGRIEDEKFVDESIHLISACQMAGFRHAIGTLWEVNDRFCVDMARLTYEGIRSGGLTDESVCRAVHLAVRELRARWLSTQATIAASQDLDLDDGAGLPGGGRERDAGMDAANHRSGDDAGRNAFLWNGDEAAKRPEEPVYWIPYVHYGV